jgi:hypothetical protein
MFELLAIAIAVVALVIARKAMNQASVLRARLDALESSAWRTAPTPPPLVLPEEPAPATAPESPTFAAPLQSAVPHHQAPPAVPDDAAGEAPAMPPPTPPEAPGFEERVGTRWVVWLGGLTLALGGFFMVRYSIDAGLLGPGVRTLLGGAFALALLAAGEWTRRKESMSAIPVLPMANIPAILTAAGTAVAFGTVYAAYALYDFLEPASAFILLGIVALGTLAAALLHGPMLAGLGIVAAFGTPLLVSSEKPNFWALYVYLAVVTAAAFGLARIRLWSWLAVTTIVLALIWILPVLKFDPPDVGPYAFHVIAGFALAALLVVCGFLFGPPADDDRVEPVSSGSLAAYLFGAMLIVLASFHANAAVVVFAVLTAAALLVAWRAPAASGAIARLPAFGDGGRFCRRLRRRWLLRTGTLDQRARAGDLVGRGRSDAACAVDRTLCPHRAPRPVDPVRNSRRAACRKLCGRDRNPDPARRAAGARYLDRALCDRLACRARTGVDLCSRQRLAHHCAGAHVNGRRMGIDAAADSIPEGPVVDPGRYRRAADRLRTAYRR